MPLQLCTQIARVESDMDDAILRRCFGKLSRKENVADFRVSVVGKYPFILGTASFVDVHTMRLWRGDMDGDRSGPGNAHTACWRRSGGLCEEWQQQLVKEIRSQAVGSHLKVVSLRVNAALRRKHDLYNPPLSDL